MNRTMYLTRLLPALSSLLGKHGETARERLIRTWGNSSSDFETTLLRGMVSNRPELLLLAMGLLLRLVFALLPLDMLLMLLEDDAWMVAAIAHNWATGQGITADGANPTNGFHPLYPLTLGALPYLAFPENLNMGFRLNLLICALLSTLALLPFYGLARAVASRPVALGGLALMAINPFLIRVSVNSMETSLALLLLLLLWWYVLVWNPDTLFGAVIIGMLATLAILARLDNGVAAVLLGVVMLWREWHQRERPWPVFSATYAMVTGALLLPYLIRNFLLFDALLPSSGRALAYMHSYQGSFAFTSGLQLAAYQTAFDLTWAPAWLLVAVLLLLAFMLVVLPAEQRAFFVPLVLYALTLTFYYSYLQQQGRPRYYVAVGFVVALLVCAWLTPQEERRHPDATDQAPGPWRTLFFTAAIILNTGLFASYMFTTLRAPYQAQPAMYDAARWIADNLPPDARLAAQNSGIFQYYSEHVVLNIDGKLNHEIIPVLERRELAAYLRNEGVSYLVDLRGVGNYIELYSSSMSEAEPHYEMSSLEKLRTYGRLLAARLGLGPPVQLDEPVPDEVFQPFDTVATVVREFPLPNDPSNAVVLYQLGEDFGAQE